MFVLWFCILIKEDILMGEVLENERGRKFFELF